MKFTQAIEAYIADMQSAGRINSQRTERSYRDVLHLHAADVGNRDPRTIGRNDCKRTLVRWPNPNTQRTRRAVLVSFYDWAMEEGHRKDNPARQTRRPKKRPTTVYRLTRDEAAALLHAASGTIERRAIHLGICAGLRNAELRGLQGQHFERDGFIHVSAEVAKGGRERWIPVIGDLEPTINEIRATVAPAHFVLPGQVNDNPPFNTRRRPVPTRPMGAATIWRLVGDVAKRAGIAAHVHPHLLRHAFGDHIARRTGLKVAQSMLGHADVSTTQAYTGTTTLDELAIAVRNVSFLTPFGYPPTEGAPKAGVETAGIEPADQTLRPITADHKEGTHDGPRRAHGPPHHGRDHRS